MTFNFNCPSCGNKLHIGGHNNDGDVIRECKGCTFTYKQWPDYDPNKELRAELEEALEEIDI